MVNWFTMVLFDVETRLQDHWSHSRSLGEIVEILTSQLIVGE